MVVKITEKSMRARENICEYRRHILQDGRIKIILWVYKSKRVHMEQQV